MLVTPRQRLNCWCSPGTPQEPQLAVSHYQEALRLQPLGSEEGGSAREDEQGNDRRPVLFGGQNNKYLKL